MDPKRQAKKQKDQSPEVEIPLHILVDLRLVKT